MPFFPIFGVSLFLCMMTTHHDVHATSAIASPLCGPTLIISFFAFSWHSNRLYQFCLVHLLAVSSLFHHLCFSNSISAFSLLPQNPHANQLSTSTQYCSSCVLTLHCSSCSPQLSVLALTHSLLPSSTVISDYVYHCLSHTTTSAPSTSLNISFCIILNSNPAYKYNRCHRALPSISVSLNSLKLIIHNLVYIILYHSLNKQPTPKNILFSEPFTLLHLVCIHQMHPVYTTEFASTKIARINLTNCSFNWLLSF